MIFIEERIHQIILTFVLCLFFQQSRAQTNESNTNLKNLVGREVALDSIDAFVETQMQVLKVPGISLAIINKGEVVYHTVKGYADIENKIEVTNKTIFEGASLSKPLFAYFVMGFVEEGGLDLDKPLYEYLPYDDIANDNRYKKITARMVLSHTTGFPNWRSDYEGNKLFLKFEPGTAFNYSGEGYQYLAKVLAHILDTDDSGLETIYQERIALPLDLKYTKYIQDQQNLENKAKGYKEKEKVEEDDDPSVQSVIPSCRWGWSSGSTICVSKS